MPPYAYKVHIDYGHEKIHTEREHEFEECRLSIALLAPIVGDHIFSVSDGRFGSCTVNWTESRDETDDERTTRITRLEAYNAEVDRRKALKSKGVQS